MCIHFTCERSIPSFPLAIYSTSCVTCSGAHKRHSPTRTTGWWIDISIWEPLRGKVYRMTSATSSLRAGITTRIMARPPNVRHPDILTFSFLVRFPMSYKLPSRPRDRVHHGTGVSDAPNFERALMGASHRQRFCDGYHCKMSCLFLLSYSEPILIFAASLAEEPPRRRCLNAQYSIRISSALCGWILIAR